MTPPFPHALRYLWDRYLELRASKSSGCNGHNKIEWLDIQAYLSVTKTDLAPWEARLIRAIDDKFIVAMSEAREGTPKENAAAARDGLAQIGKRRGG